LDNVTLKDVAEINRRLRDHGSDARKDYVDVDIASPFSGLGSTDPEEMTQSLRTFGSAGAGRREWLRVLQTFGSAGAGRR